MVVLARSSVHRPSPDRSLHAPPACARRLWRPARTATADVTELRLNAPASGCTRRCRPPRLATAEVHLLMRPAQRDDQIRPSAETCARSPRTVGRRRTRRRARGRSRGTPRSALCASCRPASASPAIAAVAVNTAARLRTEMDGCIASLPRSYAPIWRKILSQKCSTRIDFDQWRTRRFPLGPMAGCCTLNAEIVVRIHEGEPIRSEVPPRQFRSRRDRRAAVKNSSRPTRTRRECRGTCARYRDRSTSFSTRV